MGSTGAMGPSWIGLMNDVDEWRERPLSRRNATEGSSHAQPTERLPTHSWRLTHSASGWRSESTHSDPSDRRADSPADQGESGVAVDNDSEPCAPPAERAWPPRPPTTRAGLLLEWTGMRSGHQPRPMRNHRMMTRPRSPGCRPTRRATPRQQYSGPVQFRRVMSITQNEQALGGTGLAAMSPPRCQ